MQATINNKLVASLKPAALPYEVGDSKLKGFIVRVQPSGAISFNCEYGGSKRYTIASTKKLTPTKARRRAGEILAEAALGGDPMATKKAATAQTFSAFIDNHYASWALQNLERGSAAVTRLKSCFADFSDKRLADITPWIVDKLRSAALEAGRQKTGVNRDLDALKAALVKAVEWKLIDKHPIGSVKRFKVDEKPRVRWLSQAEEQSMRRALDQRELDAQEARERANTWRRQRDYPELPAVRDHLPTLILLAMNAGLRRGELFNLR